MKVSRIICGSALIGLGSTYIASKGFDTVDVAKNKNMSNKQKVRKFISNGLSSALITVVTVEGVIMFFKGCRL